jgi:hypothetical protein
MLRALRNTNSFLPNEREISAGLELDRSAAERFYALRRLETHPGGNISGR